MTPQDIHPLELEFLEAIELLDEAIAAAQAVQYAASGPTKTPGIERGAPRKRLGFIWLWGGPGSLITYLPYPWDDPSGWNEV